MAWFWVYTFPGVSITYYSESARRILLNDAFLGKKKSKITISLPTVGVWQHPILIEAAFFITMIGKNSLAIFI